MFMKTGKSKMYRETIAFESKVRGCYGKGRAYTVALKLIIRQEEFPLTQRRFSLLFRLGLQ